MWTSLINHRDVEAGLPRILQVIYAYTRQAGEVNSLTSLRHCLRRNPASAAASACFLCSKTPSFGNHFSSAGKLTGTLPRGRLNSLLLRALDMDHYFVNTHAQPNGDHEVHKVGCYYMPSDRKYLGQFPTCAGAVLEARKHYAQVNGCKHCAEECHTQ